MPVLEQSSGPAPRHPAPVSRDGVGGQANQAEYRLGLPAHYSPEVIMDYFAGLDVSLETREHLHRQRCWRHPTGVNRPGAKNSSTGSRVPHKSEIPSMGDYGAAV